MKTAFFSLPMTCNMDEDGAFREERREFYCSAIKALSNAAVEVVSPVINENWGQKKLEVSEFTSFDIESIRRSDILVVVASEKLSRDIYLEIGLALGMNKPVYCFIHDSVWTTYMLNGLMELGMIYIHRYKVESHLPGVIGTVFSARK